MWRDLFLGRGLSWTAGGSSVVRRSPGWFEVGGGHLYESLERRSLLSALVVHNLDDAGPGSLRAAIVEANARPGFDVIRFRADLAGTIHLTSGELTIADPVRIHGPGQTRLTVSGNFASRAFRVENDEGLVILRDLTIADGRARQQEELGFRMVRGGGILNLHGELNLIDVTFRNNRAEDLGTAEEAEIVGGGAIANSEGGIVRALRCSFIANSASGGSRYAFGGAIASATGSTAMVRGSLFEDNYVASGSDNFGGAVAAVGSSAGRFVNCLFFDNQARGDGSSGAYGGALAARPGSVDTQPSELFALRCSFVGNTATAAAAAAAGGGAIFNGESSLFVRQSSFHNNLATGGTASGGAIFNSQATGIVRESTLRSNQAVSIPDATEQSVARGGAIANTGSAMLELVQTELLLNEASALRAYGGGIFNGDVSDEAVAFLTLQQTQVNFNRAVGLAGSIGGSAFGGGVFNGNQDSSEQVRAVVEAKATEIDENSALAASGKIGIGGGVYNEGDFFVDRRLRKRLLDGSAANTASTSHDNLWGELTLFAAPPLTPLAPPPVITAPAPINEVPTT